MNSPSRLPNNPVLHEFDSLLDTMITLQTEERACILERRTDALPNASQSIEWLGYRLQEMEPEVRRELDQLGPVDSIKNKLAQIQRLALQNRALMEHSLHYLKKLVREFIPHEAPLETYTLDGHIPEEQLAGGILDTQI